jgi:hypothetical protein
MDQTEIEQIVGRLYLLIMAQETTIAHLKAQVAELTPKPPPTIFSIATPRDDGA